MRPNTINPCLIFSTLHNISNNNNNYYISTESPYHRGAPQWGPALTSKYTLLYNKFI